MVDLKNISEIAENLERVLQEKDQIRDQLMLHSKDIVKFSGQSIETFHSKRIEKNKETMEKAKETVTKVWLLLERDPSFSNSKFLEAALQEYAEAQLLHHLVEKKILISPEEIKVTEEAYILGVADLIGELRRYILERLVEGEIDEAKAWYSIMKELYGVILQIDFGKNLVSDYRKKKDLARILIEKTLSDLFIAVQGKKLGERMDEMGNNVEG